jgi:hypothetical protein
LRRRTSNDDTENPRERTRRSSAVTGYDMTADAAKAIEPTEDLVVIAARVAVLVDDDAQTYVDIARAIARHAAFFTELEHRDADWLDTYAEVFESTVDTRNSRAEGSLTGGAPYDRQPA